jgi:phosphomevalonate kinase
MRVCSPPISFDMPYFFSAPGKLFLSGEYAVLWGGTARVAAVPPRLTARATVLPGREVRLVSADGACEGEAGTFGLSWKGRIPRPFHFVAQAVQSVYRAHTGALLGMELSVSPSLRSASGQKLGLGGSATACVLATLAAATLLGSEVDGLKLALTAHRQAQKGRGSGGDVAAIYSGQVIRYRQYAPERLAQTFSGADFAEALRMAPAVDAATIPVQPFGWVYAFSGKSASTTRLIAAAENALTAEGKARFVQESDAVGQGLEDAMIRGDFSSLREATVALRALLAKVGPAEPPAITDILRFAEALGACGKTSGAGGGDGCILFTPDTVSAASLVEKLGTKGIFAMQMQPEEGVRQEPQAP